MDLSPSRRGAWIVNTSKHLSEINPSHPGLSHLENIDFAGKCGNLLITLSGDTTEQLSLRRVKTHARNCGIGGPELTTSYLPTLKAYGCLDWDATGNTYEVLAFSRQRVLATTSDILSGLALSGFERVLPDLLEFCLLRPRLSSEVKEYLSDLLVEEDADHLIELVSSFELLGVAETIDQRQKLYFNRYQFGDKVKGIAKALPMLSDERREELDEAIERVGRRPGMPLDELRLSESAKGLAVGLGILDVSKVPSPSGSVEFVTSAGLAPPSVGSQTSHLEDDVFHHAKMLLSSFRYGQLRSTVSRGRINDPAVLVDRLLSQGEVGPCTAIGQDYVPLEASGVIRTVRAGDRVGNQFSMQLRRREPAQIVLDLFESGVSDTIAARSVPQNLQLPLGYTGPEAPQVAAYRRIVRHDAKSVRAFMEGLRT
ncbi:hypothetical protein GBA65_21780 (plasmid) [Rubrobacter marinus]|uniref:Uncharacterized protein n=1 Tax=Rubrobacter marinus TaxID=2653852 RepID=A0A6G8Q3Q9_9ACTN|nr:hypothetical protein [Rubrobacter marinus]QIN81070.1 hypothetical protein GBA65_21780 [Rubrobacter marinus]